MSLEEKKKARDLAKKKFDLEKEKLEKSVEDKKTLAISRWMEQVQKSLNKFKEAENAYIEELEKDDARLDEAVKHQDDLIELEGQFSQICEEAERIKMEQAEMAEAKKAKAIALAKVKAGSLMGNVGDALTQKLAIIKVNKREFEDFQVKLTSITSYNRKKSSLLKC